MEIRSTLNPSYVRVNAVSVASREENTSSQNPNAPKELSPSEQAQLTQLQTRDTQVRAHEAAHLAAGAGVVTGGASFTYQTGPDNRQYAIGGEVPIDASEGSTPEETVSKMRQVRTAALAPADPSPTDYQVASTATLLEMRALQEIAKAKHEENFGTPSKGYEAENTQEESTSFYI